MFHNDEILGQMEYLTISIPKMKTKVLNIYPVIQCKPIPIFLYLKSRFLIIFLLLMNDYAWNCTCLNSHHLYVGLIFPFRKQPLVSFPLPKI